ncbi:MAG: mobile mystery protein A [Balneolaceae bacterium]|nr:mobile mystery protein A [Balneolaceae bacterium]
MDYWDKKLIREQLDQKLKKLKPLLQLPVPERGWIKTIRESLGMSTYDLADRADLDQSRISRIESAEARREIKISTLEKIADALGVTFVYGFVPKSTLEDLVREQARKIALKRMNRTDHSMKLEEQGLGDDELERALKDHIDQILVEEPATFWSE